MTFHSGYSNLFLLGDICLNEHGGRALNPNHSFRWKWWMWFCLYFYRPLQRLQLLWHKLKEPLTCLFSVRAEYSTAQMEYFVNSQKRKSFSFLKLNLQPTAVGPTDCCIFQAAWNSCELSAVTCNFFSKFVSSVSPLISLQDHLNHSYDHFFDLVTSLCPPGRVCTAVPCVQQILLKFLCYLMLSCSHLHLNTETKYCCSSKQPFNLRALLRTKAQINVNLLKTLSIFSLCRHSNYS